jgi:PAS domain S-box-containing protein
MKVKLKLSIAFISLLLWTSIISYLGISGNKLLKLESEIDELVNVCIVNSQDMQVNVFRFLNYNENVYIKKSFNDIDQTLTLAEEAKDKMKDLKNIEAANQLIDSFNMNRRLCTDILNNQDKIELAAIKLDSSRDLVINHLDSVIKYSENYRKSGTEIVHSIDNTRSFLYPIENLKKKRNEFKDLDIKLYPSLIPIDRNFRTEYESLVSVIIESSDTISIFLEDDDFSLLAVELEDSLESHRSMYNAYINSLQDEQSILTELDHETMQSIAIVRQLQTGVHLYTNKVIDTNTHLIIIFSVISVLIGLFVSTMLILDISRVLGAEPFQLDQITKKIAARDFDIVYPSEKPTGVLASIQHMAEDLDQTTVSLGDLKDEIRLKERTQQDLRDVLDSMSEGFALHEIILDENEKPIDYRFKYVNPSFESFVGISSENLIGKTVLEVFPGTESYWIEKYGRVALTGESIKFSNYFAALDRHYNVSAYSPEHGIFAVSFLDVTEQINAAKSLEEKNKFLSITLKSIGDGVIATDSEGKITFINPITESLTEWSNEEACGQSLDQVFHIVNEFSNERCENPAQKVLETGQIIELANHTTLISRNNNRHIIEDSAAPIIDSNGVIQGVIIVFRDTTEKSRMKDMINRNQRLESLSFLAGGIAHDFNNYLAGIFGYVELVKNRLEDDAREKDVEYLTKILDISKNAKSLTQQLLTFAKGDNTKREVISLKDIIYTSFNFSLRGTNVVSRISIDDDLWNCYCDANRIAQCLDNLIINGIQSMPEGGELSLTARNARNVPQQLSSGLYIELNVTDSGCGIPDHYKSKIFDPFFTTKDKGNGLGLATVFSIIESHDGTIEMESNEGWGTSFTIYLPATKLSIKKETEISENKTSGEGHILILDDQEYITEILNGLLGSLGYKTYTATKSHDALDILKKDRIGLKKIKACIVDQTLPGDAKGHEIAREMKSIDSEIILFASSGYADSDVMRNPKVYHFEDCITKPFDIKQISELMNKHIG